MKKIAFLLTMFPPRTASFVTNQILNAYNAGYEIGIFPAILNETHDGCQPEIIRHLGLMDKVIKPSPRYSNKLLYIKWLAKTLLSGRRDLISYLLKSLNPFLFGKSWTKLYMFRKVSQFYGAPGFDLYHCQFGNNGIIAAGLKEIDLLKGKIITTFHGYDAHLNDKHLQKYYHSSIRTWSRVLFKHSNLITVNTPYLLKQVIKLGADPNKIELLPMGVDTSFFTPKKHAHEAGKIQLVSVGRLEKLKSHDLGIKAVNELIKEGFNLEYNIIGDGLEKRNLLNLIDKLQIKRYVKMLGFKTQDKIKKCMQESDIFLMTSTYDVIGRRETQGVVTAEAQACGLPVVAFRSGGVPYTIKEGKTGFLAEERNVTEFTRNLRELCMNELLRKKMGQEARKFVEGNFCLSKLAQKQIFLYEKLLNE